MFDAIFVFHGIPDGPKLLGRREKASAGDGDGQLAVSRILPIPTVDAGKARCERAGRVVAFLRLVTLDGELVIVGLAVEFVLDSARRGPRVHHTRALVHSVLVLERLTGTESEL